MSSPGALRRECPDRAQGFRRGSGGSRQSFRLAPRYQNRGAIRGFRGRVPQLFGGPKFVSHTTRHAANMLVNSNRAIHQSHVIDAEVEHLIRSLIDRQQVPFTIILVVSGILVRFLERPSRHNSNYRSPSLALGKGNKTGHLE